MLYHAKSGSVKVNHTHMDYVSFGKGSKVLVLIPGLNVKGVKGTAIVLAYMYRIFAKAYKIYVFDKKNDLPEDYTIRDIADDTAFVMMQLGIEKADIFGVSQGGMVAQMLAIYYPQMVNKLVKPRDIHRFAILAKACITFDVYDELSKIDCPVLVLGGKQDKIVTGKASYEIAEKLGCSIRM